MAIESCTTPRTISSVPSSAGQSDYFGATAFAISVGRASLSRKAYATGNIAAEPEVQLASKSMHLPFIDLEVVPQLEMRYDAAVLLGNSMRSAIPRDSLDLDLGSDV